MPTATLTLPAVAEQARTARLVAGVAARRAGVASETIDDVRLVVAEALGRAVARSDANPTGTVRLDLTDHSDSFEISITDGQPIDVADEESELALSLILALAPEARVTESDPGQALVLTWPAAA
jgi:anti-sigma regulatory factor (Ser/Thr protein kinase)